MKILIRNSKIDKIPYMDGLPCDQSNLTYLSSIKFYEKFHCYYMEGIVSNNNSQELCESDFDETQLGKAIYQRLMNPLDSLVVAKMPDSLGCGLFTTNNIPLGTVICIYSGLESANQNSDYIIEGKTDASLYGGLARFMQHQPISRNNRENFFSAMLNDPKLFAMCNNMLESEADKLLSNPEFKKSKANEFEEELRTASNFEEHNFDLYRFSSSQIASQVSTSNVHYKSIVIKGIKITAMIAMRDIPPNESIGFSYGDAYWIARNIQPILFTHTGKPLEPKDYNFSSGPTTKSMIQHYNATNWLPKKPLNSLQDHHLASSLTQALNLQTVPHPEVDLALSNLLYYSDKVLKKISKRELAGHYDTSSSDSDDESSVEKLPGEDFIPGENPIRIGYWQLPPSDQWDKNQNIREIYFSIKHIVEAYNLSETLKQHGFVANLKRNNEETMCVSVDLSPHLKRSNAGKYLPKQSSPQEARYFLKAKANVWSRKYPDLVPVVDSIENNNYNQALRRACYAGKVGLVKLLYEYNDSAGLKLDPFSKTSDQRSAIDLAKFKNNQDILDFFLQMKIINTDLQLEKKFSI